MPRLSDMVPPMRRPATLLVLAAALLVGCNSEAAKPEPLPKVASASSEAEPSPTPDVGAVPADAQAPTPEGAAAFASYFYAEVTRGFAEEDPEAVRRLSAPGCIACDRFVQSMTQLRENDETVSPVLYNILGAESPGLEGDRARVTVLYDSPEIIRRSKDGAIISTEPNVRAFEEQVTLVQGPQGWLVQEVEAV